MQRAIKALDKAAVKGIIHPNNAARRKSRLMAGLRAPVGELNDQGLDKAAGKGVRRRHMSAP